MGRPPGQNSIVIKEGLHIYLRGKTWWAYIKTDDLKAPVRKTLKTSDATIARQKAWEIYDEVRHRQMSGRSVTKTDFSKLASDYLASMGNKGSAQYHADTIERHLKPFFSVHVSDFGLITNSNIVDYQQWRRAKPTASGSSPKDTTLNRESVVLRGLIKHAVKRGFLSKDAAPDVPLLKTEAARRPEFSRDELAELLKKAEARISKTDHTSTKKSRQLLFDWIVVMANSGLRPEESLKLTWGDVHLQSNKPYIHVPVAKSKRRKARNCYPMPDAIDQLRSLKARLGDELKAHGRKLKGTDPVFANWNGKQLVQIKSFITAFSGLLDACSFPREKADGVLSPESLRHTYATMRLEEGVDQHRLADNMGTSAKMIQAHYGHITLGHFHGELTKTKDQQVSNNASADLSAISQKFDEVVDALRQDKQETLEEIGRRYVLQRWEEEHGHPPSEEDAEIVDGLVLLWIKHDGKDPFRP